MEAPNIRYRPSDRNAYPYSGAPELSAPSEENSSLDSYIKMSAFHKVPNRPQTHRAPPQSSKDKDPWYVKYAVAAGAVGLILAAPGLARALLAGALLLTGCSIRIGIELGGEEDEEARIPDAGKDAGVAGCVPGKTVETYSGPPATKNVSLCQPEIQECIDGNFITTQEEVLPEEEVCDNLDNDCDGLTDGELTQVSYSGPAGTEGVGICLAGIRECIGGTLEVTQEEVVPESETCNSIDDNCSGTPDDGIPSQSFYTGPDGTEGVGICLAGIRECIGGTLEVTQEEVVPEPETCNSIDDNCSGTPDDAIAPQFSYSGPAGTEGVGICQSEIRECIDGTFQITQGEVLPETEIPNDDIDNDCDDFIDEQYFWLQISADYNQTCGVRTDNTVECWGNNFWGQSSPPDGTFSQVGTGSFHTCGVRTDNTVECWGNNEDPLTGEFAGQASPPGGTFSQVSGGRWHTCGVRTDSTIECWGFNFYGQASPPDGIFTQVSAGFNHTCGARTDNTIACWGENDVGQASSPAGTFTQVSGGGYHTCGVRTDNTVECWGLNRDGQASPPAGTFIQISAGLAYTCGVRTDNTVECWGRDEFGQSTPLEGTFSQISAGWWHTCGLRTDDTAACWGANWSGQATPPSP